MSSKHEYRLLGSDTSGYTNGRGNNWDHGGSAAAAAVQSWDVVSTVVNTVWRENSCANKRYRESVKFHEFSQCINICQKSFVGAILGLDARRIRYGFGVSVLFNGWVPVYALVSRPVRSYPPQSKEILTHFDLLSPSYCPTLFPSPSNAHSYADMSGAAASSSRGGSSNANRTPHKTPHKTPNPECHFETCTKPAEPFVCGSFCDDHCCSHTPDHQIIWSQRFTRGRNIRSPVANSCRYYGCPNLKSSKCERYCEIHCCLRIHRQYTKDLDRQYARYVAQKGSKSKK